MMPRLLCRDLRQRGVAAIEMAFILLFCFALLPIALFFARYTLHGAVVQNAVQSAARFVSGLPPEAFLNPDRRAAALAVARGMVDEAVASARLDTAPHDLNILCDSPSCDAYSGSAPPGVINVTAGLQLGDPVFMGYLGSTLPQEDVLYQARLRYGY
jgi:hypothetical protein